MKVEDVLIINSYAGSLTIAARKVGVPIRGSYEDAAYGINIQKKNFPGLDFRDRRPDWPKKQDLSRTVVLAHPPCAAFSAQNTDRKNRGVDAKKFQCTVDVLTYSMSNRAAAIAVESVVPALEGARSVHDEISNEYGYRVYRIVQNSVDFGVAQNRKRFWVIFVRDDVRTPNGDMLEIVLRKKHKTVNDVVKEKEPGPALNAHNRRVERCREALLHELPASKVNRILDGSEGFGAVPRIIKKILKLDDDLYTISKRFCRRGYMTSAPFILNPEGVANVLIHDCLWMVNGRPVSIDEYKAFMGFPRSYQFTGQDVMFLLSRGVCPPVAEWILRTTLSNIDSSQRNGWPKNPDHASFLAPGETVDLQ